MGEAKRLSAAGEARARKLTCRGGRTRLPQARISRKAAARVAGMARRRVLVWGRVSDEIAGLIEQERELYAIIPTNSALVGQLLTERDRV